MELIDVVRQVASFAARTHAEKIKIFGWFLHTYGDKDRFSVSDIRSCYQTVHLESPGNIHRSVDALSAKNPPDLLRDKHGFRLTHSVREQIDQFLGRPQAVLAVERMLADLPGKISDESERLFLSETLTCYRNSALRAAIVMSWNLAYDHLTRWILSDIARLAAFNAGIQKRNPKKAYVTIVKRDDFEELKEDETVDIVGTLPGIGSGIKKILKEKLGRRNTYAHPSTLKVDRAQVDDMITDLVNNVVLTLKI